MDMVCTNDGKLYVLGCVFGNGPDPLDDYIVELFKNDYTPEDESETADFTPADFPGYLSVSIASGSMNPPAIVGNVGEQEYVGPPIYECTGGGGQLVYGWYMRGAASGKTYFAQRFDTPRNMVTGSVESLDPFKIRCKSFVICP